MTRALEGQPAPIRFMTFNVRFDTIRDAAGGNRWSDRIESVAETLRRNRPDVVGFQEALRTQLHDLTDVLPGYHGVGKPREIGPTAEYVPVFFDVRRFELEEYGDFWLSPTPEVEGSRGWDTDVPRHCTWVRLKEHVSDLRFAVFNTHLDRWGAVARSEAAKVIVARRALAGDVPAVLLGDLNAEEGSEPVETLRAAGFRDSFRELYPDATDVQTVHHYGDLSGTRKIDYVMCDARWRVAGAAIVREEAAGRFPSDHFPVLADLVPEGAG
ncbi:MAG TPA: endonuclease/exonuclease/phosphatase family protein [Actinomycetota bacterium]|nr:endonuclease/exonuclease/phosphatase family protein [Actinomycetota bacterium]